MSQQQRNLKVQLKCALHSNQDITHFCETCNDAVCSLCIDKQPHSGPMHNIVDLQQAANIRKNSYVNFLTKSLNPIRKEAQERIKELQQIRKQQEGIRQVIQKDIRVEFESIKSRLQQKVASIITQIHIEMKHYQMYIQQLDDLFETFNQSYDNPQAFLISYLNLHQQIKKLESINFQAESVDRQKWIKKIQTLPRELPEIYLKVKKLPHLQERNQFINELMEKYLKYYHEKIKTEKANSVIKAKKINHTYNEVISKLVSQQNTAKLCIFCGSPFSIDAVNEGCPNNRTYKINASISGSNWQQIIPNQLRGSKQHFWYEIDEEHRKRPDLATHSMIRKNLKKHYLNSLKELESVKFAIKKYQIDNDKTFTQVFAANDASNTGYVSKVAFHYNMAKLYKIPENLISSLINLLFEQDKGVNYGKLMEVLENPFEDFIRFEQEQEELEKSKPVAPVSLNRFRY